MGKQVVEHKRLGVILIGTFFLAGHALAFNITFAEDWTYLYEKDIGPRHVNLNPTLPSYVAVGSPEALVAESLIEARWEGWGISVSETAWPGTITVSNYSAYLTPFQAGGGIEFELASNPVLLVNARWVQVIWTDFPPPGASSPYLDPYPNDDGLPYYYTEEDHDEYLDGGTYRFVDWPGRPYDGSRAIHWTAVAFVVDRSNTGPYSFLSIYDGVKWGWETIGNDPNGGPMSGNTQTAHTPVPEPATLLVVFVGIATIMRRRRC